MADERIVIDASAFESIDYDTFFTTYFSGLGNGTRKFYGDVSSGMYGYVTGDQVGINWSTTTVGSKYVLIEGEDIAYDGRLPNNGHGYSGSIDTITFGSVGADTVIAPDTPASGQPRGLISGVVPGLVISNLGVSMPEGNNLSGVDPADAATYNELYAYLTLIRDIDKGSNLANYVKLLYDSLATHAQHFIGTDGNDKYTGTAFGDLIEGGDGDDVIDGGGGDDIFVLDGNRADYTITDDGNGVFTVSGGTTGEDKLENVEYLRFNDLTYDLRDGSINYVPTDLAISATAIEGDSDVDTIVGKLTVTDLENVGGAPDVHTFELIDTADGMFKVDGQGNIRVAGDLAVGNQTVVVRVTDSAGQSYDESFTIAVSYVAPQITSNDSGARAWLEIAENTKVVATVAARGMGLQYSLSGADAALFSIDANGNLSFKSAPDFESAKDAGKNNVYDVTVRVSDGSLSDTQALKIEVTDVKGKTFNGTSSSETLKGTLEADVLNGGKGNDTLKGGAGNDKLYGGAGADKLYGEAGADIFVFRAKGDSTLSSKGRDTIYDFDGKAGDRIDLSGFDANDKKGGMQDFSFIGSSKFSGKAGELRYEKVKGDTFVYADTNGDKTADFAIKFDDTITFQKGYFLL